MIPAFKIGSNILSKMLLASLSRRVIEYVTFSFLEYLVKRTETKYDDELLKLIKNEYYSRDAE